MVRMMPAHLQNLSVLVQFDIQRCTTIATLADNIFELKESD